jgi:hypothetical protein
MARLVHIIHVQRDGSRIWLNRVDRLRNESAGQWFSVPIWDDDPRQSRPMDLEFARVARRRWQAERAIVVHFALDPSSDFIDEVEPPAPPVQLRGEREPILATLDRVQPATYYRLLPVDTVTGPQWCLKFPDHPELTAQYVVDKNPVDVLRKAQERGLLAFATPETYEPPKPTTPSPDDLLPSGTRLRTTS